MGNAASRSGRDDRGSLLGTILTAVGLLVSVGALLGLLHASALAGGAPAAERVLVATGVFLVGVFVFGYGAGKRTTY